MNVILTNLDEPLVSESINHGTITVEELKIWSDWKQHSGFIATYQWKSQPNVVRKIEIGNNKVISEAFDEELNKSSAGATIAKLSYKDGKVGLYLKSDTQLFNVRIADEIARALKIKPDKPNTGEPVDVDKIFFHNTPNIYLTCEQVKSNTYINSQKAETVLASTSFNPEVEVTSFVSSTNSTPFYACVGQLVFHIQDERGNNLPVKKLFCRVRINDERLRNGKNISSDTSNSTA